MDSKFNQRLSVLQQNGFVLLMVIAVITILATVMVGVANLSFKSATAAAAKHDQLQLKWGQRTLRSTLLPPADRVFRQMEEQIREDRLSDESAAGPWPVVPSFLDDAIDLGRCRFRLRMGDEDAKVNLNVVYHYGGLGPVNDAVRSRWQGPIASVRPTPLVQRTDPDLVAKKSLKRDASNEDLSDDEDENASDRFSSGTAANSSTPDQPDSLFPLPRAFRRWSHLVSKSQTSVTDARSGAVMMLSNSATIAGSGPLNVHRCGEKELSSIASVALGNAGGKRFAQNYRKNPYIDLEAFLVQQVSVESTRQKLATLIKTNSECFSLWMDGRSRSGGRTRSWTYANRGGPSDGFWCTLIE